MLLGYEDYLDTFAGFPVWRWDDGVPEDPAAVAWRVDDGHREGRFAENFEAVLESAGPEGPIALIIGNWGAPFQEPFPVDFLTGNADRLRGLRALFIGEIASEEAEISWIRHGDITPILETFPGLQHLWVRGGSRGLTLRPVRHGNLHELVLQGGGLSAELVRALSACDLPLIHLEHLVLNHHFMSPEVAQRLVDDLPGVAVDVGDPQDEEEWGRYTAVSE